MRIPARILVTVGTVLIAGTGPAAAGDEAVAAVRARRAESNAAIASHDAARLRGVLHDDYVGIQGSSQALDRGGAATAASYGETEFRDPTFIRYERTPDAIETARSGRRVAESGRWVGEWRKVDGTMRKSGRYLAVWVYSDGAWRVKSELFVTLDCTGSAECADAG